MSDEIETIIDAPSDKDGKTQQTDTAKDDWKQIVNGKYKTEAELARAYKELETKLGEQSKEIEEGRQFAQVMNPILEEIKNDPEIFDKLETKLKEKGKPAKKEDKKESPLSDETRSATSEIILNRFESKYGIDKLSDEDRRKMRADIGNTILDLTGLTLQQVDLRRLNSVLENAYVLANKDKLIERAKAEALSQKENLDGASISTITSSQGKSEKTLNSEEATVASKLGLTRDQYLAGKTR